MNVQILGKTIKFDLIDGWSDPNWWRFRWSVLHFILDPEQVSDISAVRIGHNYAAIKFTPGNGHADGFVADIYDASNDAIQETQIV